MAISFLYFISGFIGMYALIKKFQQSNENAETTMKEYQTQDIAIKSMNVPRLSKRALGLEILARWLRLAFPTYLVVLIAAALFPYMSSGPTFLYYIQNYI